MKVIGADLGLLSGKTTFALVEIEADRVTFIESLKVETAPVGRNADGSWFPRLSEIARQFADWLPTTGAEAFGFEAVYLNKNPRVTIALATLGGILGGIALSHSLPAARVYPVQGKVALAGNSQAGKDDMVAAARHILGIETDEHTADAIGVALHTEMVARMQSLTGAGEIINIITKEKL